MANTKDFFTRIQNKHDTEANWLLVEEHFIPKAGEIIIYDPDNEYNYSRIRFFSNSMQKSPNP